MNTNKNASTPKEASFKDIFNILNHYKWSIIFITLISLFLTYSYLYFKPSIYKSYAILKVKSSKNLKSSNLIDGDTPIKQIKDVTEEISLLKTFKMNSSALDKIDMRVQYFIKKEYKTIEIFNKLPFNIKNIHIFNPNIIGKMLILTPQRDGYSIQYKNSYKEKIKYAFFQEESFQFDNSQVFPYNKQIDTKYFNLSVTKNFNTDTPIYFIINPDNRKIFEQKIKPNLTITQVTKDTSLIEINYLDTIPQRAQLYINSLIDDFITYSIKNKNSQNSEILNFIDQELKTIKRELQESEEVLENYQVEQNIIEPSMQASIFIKNLSEIEIKISENNLKRKLILNLISFVENNYNLDAIAPSLSKLNDKNTLELISKLQTYQFQVDELTTEYTDEYPKLKTIRKQIQNIRKKIETNLRTLRTDIEYQTNTLLARKDKDENNLKMLPSQERQLVNIKRNYEVKAKMYEYLLKKKSENNMIKLVVSSDYQIIDSAYNSLNPIKPKRSFILLLGTILGFILGSILAFFRYTNNHNIQNKDDIERLTSLPIYGTIPFYKHKRNEIQVNKNVKSPFTESFRTLRTTLEFKKENKNSATTILVTSIIAAEGKTTISANLATILEMARYRTIVINLDLRKPSLHKYFDISNDMGMSRYLNGDSEIEEIIFQTEFANLDIIPSGVILDNPSELILSQRLPNLLNCLKEKYDYIIIDSAPIGIVMDTKTIMKYSDLNLIILREDYAQKEFISIIEEMIEKYKFKNIGFILNASKEVGGEHGYGYSYEYKAK